MAANEHTPNLIDRTLRRFRTAWRFTGKGRGALKDGVAPDLPDDDLERMRRQIDACLEARGGEVSARARAAELGEAYLVLDQTGRRRFLDILAREYGPEVAAIDAAVADRADAPDEAARVVAEARLRRALVPPRERLLRQFNTLTEAAREPDAAPQPEPEEAEPEEAEPEGAEPEQ